MTPPPSSPLRQWHILTGEYPPKLGGVADYTALLAEALGAAGCSVHVWCRGTATEAYVEPTGTSVHLVAGRFGPQGLARLGGKLNRFAAPRTILIQYAPQAFGAKGMNLLFVGWVAWRAGRGDEIRVMFHETAHPWGRRPWRHNIIAAIHRVMLAVLLRASRRVYVSIPAWCPLLRRLGSGSMPLEWTPVPTNIPAPPSSDLVAITPREARSRTGPLVVGHFGTYTPSVTPILGPILRHLLDRRADLRVLLIGARGEGWSRVLTAGRPDWVDRVHAPGAQPGPAVSDLLRSCDCLVQPYPDGVTTRRTTLMAALANAVPVVTNLGRLSEPLWADGAVALAPGVDPDRMADLVVELLDSPDRRLALGRRGRQLYEEQFAIAHTVAALLARP